MKIAKIFLSHAAVDGDLAVCLKTALEEKIPGTEAFCSSDPTDLPPGAKWPTKIQTELERADILLLLATSRSLSRPWVWFEAGTFWFADKKLIPLCIGPVRKNSLPPPFSERTGLNLDDPSDIERLLEELSSTTKALDIPLLVRSLEEKDRAAAERVLVENPAWIGVGWNGRFLSYDGPVEGLRLVEDEEVYQDSMKEALTAGGFDVRFGGNRLSSHVARGYRIVYLTDQKSWRRKVAQRGQVLLAKPKSA